MMCTSQSHSHGCEYRSDIQHRPQDDTEVMKDERQDVDEVKRKMPLRSLITNPSQNARYECPEIYWLIVSYVVSLKIIQKSFRCIISGIWPCIMNRFFIFYFKIHGLSVRLKKLNMQHSTHSIVRWSNETPAWCGASNQ